MNSLLAKEQPLQQTDHHPEHKIDPKDCKGGFKFNQLPKTFRNFSRHQDEEQDTDRDR